MPVTGRLETSNGNPIELEWRHGSTLTDQQGALAYDGHTIIKSETLPDGRRKMILKDKDTGDFVDRIVSG